MNTGAVKSSTIRSNSASGSGTKHQRVNATTPCRMTASTPSRDIGSTINGRGGESLSDGRNLSQSVISSADRPLVLTSQAGIPWQQAFL